MRTTIVLGALLSTLALACASESDATSPAPAASAGAAGSAGASGASGAGAAGASGAGPSAGAAGAASKPSVDPQIAASLRDDLASLVAQHGLPGAALALVVDGETVYQTAVGVQGPGETAALLPESRFRIGSTGKLLVSIALLTYVAEGKLSLDARVIDHVPWFTRGPDFDAGTVLVRHLLTHTSGVPDTLTLACPEGTTLEAFFKARAKDPLWAPSGRLHNYSNQGYALAAAVLEAVSGKPFRDVIRERVFTPLAMTTAAWDPAEVPPALATRGASGTQVRSFADDPPCDALAAAGGTMATVGDMARLVAWTLGDGQPLLPPAQMTALRAVNAPIGYGDTAYGLGVYVAQLDGTPLLHHTGASGGWLAYWASVPSARVGAVMMTNGEDAGLPQFAGVAVRRMLGRPAAPPPVLTDPATWTKYVGTYTDGYGKLGSFDVKLADQKLWLARAGKQDVELTQAAEDLFRMPSPIPAGTFFLDGAGKAEFLATRLGVARRIGD